MTKWLVFFRDYLTSHDSPEIFIASALVSVDTYGIRCFYNLIRTHVHVLQKYEHSEFRFQHPYPYAEYLNYPFRVVSRSTCAYLL